MKMMIHVAAILLLAVIESLKERQFVVMPRGLVHVLVLALEIPEEMETSLGTFHQ